MKKLLALLLLFTATVRIPLDKTRVYTNIRHIEPNGFHYILHFEAGKKVYVPIMFTVIEEQS